MKPKTIGPKKLWKDRLLYFFMGIFAVLGVMVLSGAVNNATDALNYGRFQLETWATRFDGNSAGMGAFVIDTATGETKTVYSRIYGEPPQAEVINRLNTPFYLSN